MNSTQTQTTTATLIAFVAGILAGRNVFGLDTQTWVTVLTAAAGFAMAIWTVVSTRKNTLVSAVAAMPEVKSIDLDKNVAGSAAMADATPSNVQPK